MNEVTSTCFVPTLSKTFLPIEHGLNPRSNVCVRRSSAFHGGHAVQFRLARPCMMANASSESEGGNVPSGVDTSRTETSSGQGSKSSAEIAGADTDVNAEASKPVDDSDIFETEVPGKIVLTPEQLAEQRQALERYAEILRQDRLKTEARKSRLFGFVPFAETLNGRFAMFFFVTGLLTEYWTDYSIPDQIELLLRTLGVI